MTLQALLRRSSLTPKELSKSRSQWTLRMQRAQLIRFAKLMDAILIASWDGERLWASSMKLKDGKTFGLDSRLISTQRRTRRREKTLATISSLNAQILTLNKDRVVGDMEVILVIDRGIETEEKGTNRQQHSVLARKRSPRLTSIGPSKDRRVKVEIIQMSHQT